MSQLPIHPALKLLTRHPLKPSLYSQESFFREAFSDLESVLGGRTADTILQHGLVVIKPDGYALCVTGNVVGFCVEHGFEVVDMRPVQFAPVVWRSLWTYQMTRASLDRLLVNDLILRGEGIALLLRRTSEAPVPAAVELSALKGPARMDEQRDDCLRRVIRQPNVIFSLIHAADEPADFVRELGILFGMPERLEMAGAMATGVRSPASGQLLDQARRSRTAPRRTFDRAASRDVVIGATREASVGPGQMQAMHGEVLRRGTEALRAGHRLPVPAFLRAVAAVDIPVDPWDLAVTLSEIIELDDPGASKVIDNVAISEWRQGDPT